MRRLKLFLIFLGFLVYLAVGAGAHLIFDKRRRWRTLNRLTFFLIRGLNRVLGIRVQVVGKRPSGDEGTVILCRHIGYIDGLVLGGLIPLTFVSKSEVKRWPVIGAVTRIAGTVFINRRRRWDVSNSLGQINDRLRGNVPVLIFPEGTSTDGTEILPFQTVFFEPPIATRSTITPVTVRYTHINGKDISLFDRNEICWYGQTGFASHLWNLLKFRRIDAQVTIHEKISTGSYAGNAIDRKRLARECHRIISQFSRRDAPAVPEVSLLAA